MKYLPKTKSLYCYLRRLLYLPYSPCFSMNACPTALAGSWVLISTAQVSCQSISNKSVSKMLIEDTYSFEKLQFTPWKPTGLEFQLRRSCSSNADLWKEGRDACWWGAGHWLPSVKSPLLWNLLPPIVCCSPTFSSLKWHFRFFPLDMLSVSGEFLFCCWFWFLFCVSCASSSQSVQVISSKDVNCFKSDFQLLFLACKTFFHTPASWCLPQEQCLEVNC